jgi:hypothetical protein
MSKDKEKKEENEKDEVKVTLDQVPAAARKTLEEQAAGAKIDVVDKETDDAGKTIYETDVKIGGTNYEIKVAPDGSLISKKVDQEDEKNEKKESDEKEEKEEKK